MTRFLPAASSPCKRPSHADANRRGTDRLGRGLAAGDPQPRSRRSRSGHVGLHKRIDLWKSSPAFETLPKADIEPARLRAAGEPMDQRIDQETSDAIARARLISAALPYMLRYDGKVVVVKYGGHAMGDPELA